MKEDRTIEKMELIIAALEKQVPEKPELQGDGYDPEGNIPWEDNRGFSVECIRDDEDSNIYDEDGKLMDDRKGVPIQFQVYYQVNHYDEDCCKLTSKLSAADMVELRDFIEMYR